MVCISDPVKPHAALQSTKEGLDGPVEEFDKVNGDVEDVQLEDDDDNTEDTDSGTDDDNDAIALAGMMRGRRRRLYSGGRSGGRRGWGWKK